MKNKILLIEDNGYVANQLKDRLEENTYMVHCAYSVADAKNKWEAENGKFDCIILDLHINPLGLDTNEVLELTPLFGMAVLKFFAEHPSCSETAIKQKTIIYSGYVNEFINLFSTNLFAAVIARDADSIEKVVKTVNRMLEK